MNLPWKTAWIVGGSSGLGAEVSRRLSMFGTEVFVSARRKEVLNDVCDGLDNVHALPLDITNIEECMHVATALFKMNAKLPDLIILNAAIYTPMNTDNLDPYECANMIDVNYMGVVNMFSALLPFKSIDKPVTIATVTSPSGWRGLPGGIGYGPSKAAVINFIESMKPELSQAGFDLRLVNPGFIKTRLTDKNEFSMPQIMEVEDAAMRTLKGLATNKFDISFPNPFIMYLKILRILPYRLFFSLMRRIVAKRSGDGP